MLDAMGSSDAHRWQAGMGAVAASLVAGAMVSERATWTSDGVRSLALAEGLLRGDPLPIDVALPHAAAVAVGLASGQRPLLADVAVSEFIDVVGAWLTHARLPEVADERLDAAIAEVARGADFAAAIEHADDEAQAVLNATMVGLVGGLGCVPARSVSSMTALDGRLGRRYIARLVDRLLGIEREPTYDPKNRRGPREVLPGLWLSNIYGVRAFVSNHPDGLVLSLCDPEGRLDKHEQQITFHLDDTARSDANPSLDVVLNEVLGEIAAARVEGQPVLVHCRHGASRTGLVLRLLLVDELGLAADEALIEAQCLWPHTSEWNKAWARVTERRSINRPAADSA